MIYLIYNWIHNTGFMTELFYHFIRKNNSSFSTIFHVKSKIYTFCFILLIANYKYSRTCVMAEAKYNSIITKIQFDKYEKIITYFLLSKKAYT